MAAQAPGAGRDPKHHRDADDKNSHRRSLPGSCIRTCRCRSEVSSDRRAQSQQRAGGNPPRRSKNLFSRVLRDRKKMKAKIKAMPTKPRLPRPSSARSTVMLLVYITESYISLLWTEPLGRMMLGCAIWMSIGIMVDAQDDQFRLFRTSHAPHEKAIDRRAILHHGVCVNCRGRQPGREWRCLAIGAPTRPCA